MDPGRRPMRCSACSRVQRGDVRWLTRRCLLRTPKPRICLRGAAASASNPVVDVVTPVEPALKKDKHGQTIIGTVRNVYGMQTAATVTDHSVAKWVADAFCDELNAAGYQAHVVGQTRSIAPRAIKLEITH